MDWDIHEEKQNNKENEAEYLVSWDSQIRLSLPNLGEILINISLSNHDIKINIGALQSETICLLKNNQPQPQPQPQPLKAHGNSTV